MAERRFVHGRTIGLSLHLEGIRVKITGGLQNDPHDVTLDDDLHRRELLSILVEMEKQKSPLEDGLPHSSRPPASRSRP